jgi:UDP-GlcNAc:undecaprenyl-phosphate GlcNAc-1-phosphate transferase
MLVPIIGLGLPIVDTLLAIVRRMLRGRPIFSADREHIHHKLLQMGFTHRGAVLVLYSFCLTLATLGLAMTYAEGNIQFVVICATVIVVVIGLRRLGYLDLSSKTVRQTTEVRTRNQSLRSVVREIGQQLKAAQRVDQLWDSIKFLAPAFGAREMKMTLALPESAVSGTATYFWQDPEGQKAGSPCVVRMPIERAVGGEVAVGELEVTWTDGRDLIDRDDEIALEMVKDYIDSALDRLTAREVTPGKGPRLVKRTGTDGSPGESVETSPGISTVLEFRRRNDH